MPCPTTQPARESTARHSQTVALPPPTGLRQPGTVAITIQPFAIQIEPFSPKRLDVARVSTARESSAGFVVDDDPAQPFNRSSLVPSVRPGQRAAAQDPSSRPRTVQV